MKPRLQFRQPTGWTVSQIPTPGGRYLKYRPPLASWQPSDPACTAQISRIAGASSSSGSDSRAPLLPPRPSQPPTRLVLAPHTPDAPFVIRLDRRQSEAARTWNRRARGKGKTTIPQKPNMAHCGTVDEQVWRCSGGAPASQDVLGEPIAGTLLSPCLTG